MLHRLLGAIAREARYLFRLLALDVEGLDLKTGTSREQVEDAAAMHTIGTAEMMGRYGR